MKILEGIRPGKWNWMTRLSLGALIVVGMMSAHPFFLSVTDIEYFPQEEILGLTIKVFTDDLELVLEELGAESLRLGTDEEGEDADQMIARYLDRVIRWRIDSEPVTMIWLGKEVEREVTYLYLEAKIKSMPLVVEVSHGLFLDQLETQENIVHLHCGNDLRSVRLNMSRQAGVLSCE